MARSACLIFNPVAGQGDSEEDLATIKSILEPEFDHRNGYKPRTLGRLDILD